MSAPLFSILVPSVHRRVDQLAPLIRILSEQADGLPVEVVCVLDNMRRSIGAKRQACLDIARGDYVAYVDDDDMVSGDYVSSVVGAIMDHAPDVVCFDQFSYLNGRSPYRVSFVLGAENEVAREVHGHYIDIIRPPWHVCAWKRSIAIQSKFPDTNYGEDWIWAERLQPLAKTSVRIARILHEYRYDDRTSEASR